MAAMLFYETPVALNRERHRHLKLAPATGQFPFAQRTNSVLLAATELADAATSYPVVFVGNAGGPYALAAIVGLSDGQNLFLDADNGWAPDAYIPAFVRRYPFVLAEKPPGAEGDDFTVFLDEAYEGFNSAEGERLFKEDGSESDMLKNAVNFLGEFQQHVARTKQLMEDLRKYDLLEPRNIRLERNGNVINLNGLYVVSEEKLRKLDAETTHRFLTDGTLGWIYAHLLSLMNIDRVGQRLAEREESEAANATKN